MSGCDTSFNLEALLAEISATHHVLLRREVHRIEGIASQMTRSGDEDDWIIEEITQIARGLSACVAVELEREEQVLFPMLQRLAEQSSISSCRAGMIRSRVMLAERELARVRGVMVRLRELAEARLSPDGPCETCHELLGVIRPLMADLWEHTRKESEILFPWAIARENALSR